MSKNDLNKLSKVELEKKLSESKEALTNLRFQKVLQQLEYPQKINVVKKEIARIKTIIREFTLGIR